LVLRDVHAVVLRLLGDLLAAMSSLAERGAEMVEPGRTHGQQAVPITFGLKVAAWIDEIARHVERLREAEKRVFTAMLGGAVGSFASLGTAGPAVQAGVARRLGLQPMRVPSRAVSDSLAEYVCILALLAGSGGKIAGEIYALMKTEVGEVREPAPAGTIGSSTMPHKRNPQLADDCVTISAQIRSSVPLALEGMLHDHEVDGAHTAMTDDAVQRVCILTGDLLTRLVRVLSGLELDEARMRANLELTDGLISSERVMLALGATIGRPRGGLRSRSSCCDQRHDLRRGAQRRLSRRCAPGRNCDRGTPGPIDPGRPVGPTRAGRRRAGRSAVDRTRLPPTTQPDLLTTESRRRQHAPANLSRPNDSGANRLVRPPQDALPLTVRAGGSVCIASCAATS
jgi:adenylosuccinate lyase